MIERCYNCQRKKILANRCIRCYIQKKASEFKITKFKWYKEKILKFEHMLTGRYIAIASGDDPGSCDILIKLFTDKGGARIFRSNGKCKSAGKRIGQLKRIITNVENAARRNYECQNHSEKEEG